MLPRLSFPRRRGPMESVKLRRSRRHYRRMDSRRRGNEGLARGGLGPSGRMLSFTHLAPTASRILALSQCIASGQAGSRSWRDAYRNNRRVIRLHKKGNNLRCSLFHEELENIIPNKAETNNRNECRAPISDQPSRAIALYRIPVRFVIARRGHRE